MKNWRLVVVAISVASCGGPPPPEAPPPPASSATAAATATVAPPADPAVTDKLVEDANAAAKSGDHAAAATMFERACTDGHARACAASGLLLAKGTGVEKDDGRALAAFTRACDKGDNEGCFYQGYLLDSGRGAEKNAAKAIPLYERACESGFGPACLNLGVMALRGEGGPKDEARAAKFFEPACDKGELAACGDLGTLYWRGAGVTQDRARALKLWEGACEKGQAKRCNVLGEAYYHGNDVPKDEARAVAFFEQGCAKDAGGEACKNLAIIKANAAKAAEPKEFEGTIVARTGNTVRVKLPEGVEVPSGASADLSRYFEGKAGDASPLGVLGGLFGGSIKGWVGIALVKVGETKQRVVSLTIVEEKSKMAVNGRKTNHFTPAARVKLLVVK